MAATGTGKTVISAFDYKRFRKENPGRPNRLLFIAHREEILQQSMACFRGVLKEANFGDLFVGGFRPNQVDHLFISVQTLNSKDWFARTTPDFYDYIIVDESHHTPARTYQKLLSYYQPKLLLGLTATPERMDEKSVTKYFGNHITAEIRLPEAIERRLLCPFQMFYCTVWPDAVINLEADEARKNLAALSRSPVLLAELKELLNYNYDQIDFIDEPVQVDFECPLDVHCTYTRDQLLVGLGFMKPATVREGVKWLPEKQVDVFLITLNKSAKEYSPTTMYNDYSINEWLFHWQSQSTTSANSPTGQRYIQHKERGTKVMLFVREFKTDVAKNSATPYTFLGLADYLKHEGSRPMNITYRLHKPIPAKYLKKTNKLVVG